MEDEQVTDTEDAEYVSPETIIINEEDPSSLPTPLASTNSTTETAAFRELLQRFGPSDDTNLQQDDELEDEDDDTYETILALSLKKKQQIQTESEKIQQFQEDVSPPPAAATTDELLSTGTQIEEPPESNVKQSTINTKLSEEVSRDLVSHHSHNIINIARLKQAIMTNAALPELAMFHAFRNPKAETFCVVSFQTGFPIHSDQLLRQREYTRVLHQTVHEHEQRHQQTQIIEASEVQHEEALIRQQRKDQRQQEATAAAERRRHHLEYLRQRARLEQQFASEEREANNEARAQREKARQQQIQDDVSFLQRVLNHNSDHTDNNSIKNHALDGDFDIFQEKLNKIHNDALLRIEQEHQEALADVQSRAATLGPVVANIQRRDIERNFAARKRVISAEVRSRLSAGQGSIQRRDFLLAPINYHKMIFSKSLSAY